MLSERWNRDALSAVLLARADWRPHPTASDRAPWDGIPAGLRDIILEAGDDAVGHEWPPLPATLFLDFARTGNRRNYERVTFGRRSVLRDLVLAECVANDGRFVDDIVNGVWAICEESFWGIPACMYMQQHGPGLPDVEEPVVPLFVAETVALLAWTTYLLEPQLDAVSPLIVPRIKNETATRVLGPLLERDDFWWMGLTDEVHPITGRKRRVNNWNPWIVSNWLTAALLLEDDEPRRVDHVAKAVRALDRFIDPYPADGGCDEGPSYWGRAGASLFDCLELLSSATGGEIDVYDDDKIREIGRFVFRAQIADRWFVNFADASALVLPSPSITYLYGSRIGDDDLMDFGAWAAKEQGDVGRAPLDSIGRALPALFAWQDILDRPPRQPLPRDVWLPDIEVVVARDRAGSSDGLFVTAKGGHNEESHNHNDVGTFSVYADGRPLLVDAGVETYTAKTFSPDRYDIWTMQTAYHNLPTFNDVQQEAGAEYRATDASYESDDAGATFSVDIAKAYPAGCGVESWRRTVRFVRGESVTVEDRARFSTSPRDLQWHLLTPSDVETVEPGLIRLVSAPIVGDLVSADGWLRFDARAVDVEHETIDINDERMSAFWGSRLVRINLTARDPGHRRWRSTSASRKTDRSISNGESDRSRRPEGRRGTLQPGQRRNCAGDGRRPRRVLGRFRQDRRRHGAPQSGPAEEAGRPAGEDRCVAP